MKKIIDIFKKYKLAILIASIIIIIGITLIFVLIDKKINTKTFENNYYIFNYDEKWKISSKSNLVVKLKNGSKASLNIELVKIDDEYKYSDLSDIIDKLLYDINSQNENYNLISKKDDTVTKTSFNGYKLLYENDSSQAMVVIAKSGNKIIIFNYEAENKYFDILLDSVQNIIYNFKLKPDEFDLSYKISVETSAITYSNNDELVKKLTDLKAYDIANQNYYVNYSLPSIFKLTNMDSKIGIFEYYEDSNRISIITNVLNYNIYDYIDSSKSYGNIYSDYSYIKNHQDKNKNFEDKLSEFKIGNYSGYMYKISYTSTEYETEDIEAYLIAIALNKNHLFLIKIEGYNIKIPKELIEQIKINSVKNYSSYITKNISNGTLAAELKRFSNNDYTEYDSIKIKIPVKYIEIDKESNIYTDRYFGLNYDSNNDVYQYNVHYALTPNHTPIETQINLANSNMGAYKSYGNITEMSAKGIKNINGKNFSTYEGSYYKKGKLYNSSDESVIYKVNKKMLIYELENGGCLVIIIDGNNIEVVDSILNELSNFEISKEIYK